ncbi:hypothetical protein B4168_2855 [Anoxybacillus flavithermus]|nr:hypothetical protein B4168_2855 [Anoxybacillus flavithermus]OAO84911.1 hypothetical protein GT23_3297 [Parageobacillus thermoglucosidasius]
MAQRKINETSGRMEQVCWVKPANVRTGVERKEDKQVISEILDTAVSI